MQHTIKNDVQLLLFFITLLLLMISTISGYAKETDGQSSYFDMSFEELAEIEIALPSKKKEPLFDSPLSASVITREKIQRSGVFSIPEALRLVPGVIVREQTPGIFDVHVLGFDYLPPGSPISRSPNTLTLVMIDNRIVYNYYQGGTFWETLPISINDVERIEVVHGPAAALYGPNAVTGVINIITRRPDKQGWSINAHAEGGTFRSRQGYVSLFYNHKDKLSAGISANVLKRDRHQTSYYEYAGDRYVDRIENVIGYDTGRPWNNTGQRYPDGHKAREGGGINAFMNFRPKDDVKINISGGYQDSRAHTVVLEAKTPLTTRDSETGYFDMMAQIKGLSAQFSLDHGDQNLVRGGGGMDTDHTTYDLRMEYEAVWGKLKLLPGVWFRKADYTGDFIKGTQELTNNAFSLRVEYSLLESVRLIGAWRTDKYNLPHARYHSWQFAGTWAINDRNLLRAVYSRAHRAPFFNYTYTDFLHASTSFELTLEGNRHLDLLTRDMFEIGFRANLFESVQVDLGVFYAVTKDFSDFEATTYYFNVPGSSAAGFKIARRYENLDLEAEQFGFMGSLSYTPSSKWHITVFTTLQRTFLDDYAPDQNRSSVQHDKRHRGTPSLYGGIILNHQLSQKTNINLNAYYYTAQDINHLVQKTRVHGKLIVNAKVLYRMTNNWSVFFNARNLFDNHKQEFAFVDEIKGTYLVGFDFSY